MITWQDTPEACGHDRVSVCPACASERILALELPVVWTLACVAEDEPTGPLGEVARLAARQVRGEAFVHALREVISAGLKDPVAVRVADALVACDLLVTLHLAGRALPYGQHPNAVTAAHVRAGRMDGVFLLRAMLPEVQSSSQALLTPRTSDAQFT